MKRGIGLIIALSVLTLFTGCANEGLKTYEQATEAFRQGRYEEAVSLYRLAISQGKKDAVVSADLALAYQCYGDPEKADDAMDIALSGGETPGLLKKRGLLLYLRKSYEEAADAFLKALPENRENLNPDGQETLAFLAECRKLTGNTREAVALYQELIRLGHHTMENKLKIGECLLMDREFYSACTYFDWALEEAGAGPEEYLFIYRAANAAGDFYDSELYFQKGIAKCGPESMTEGEYYARAGKFSVAVSLLSDETSTGAVLSKASIATKEGRFDEAESYYVDLIARGEDLSVVYHQYMLLKAAEGDLTAAKQLLTQVRSYQNPAIERDVAWNEIIIAELEHDYKRAYDLLAEYEKKYEKSEETEREIRFLSRVFQ